MKMRILLLTIGMVLARGAAHAQSAGRFDFQQPGWVAAPGSRGVAMRVTAPEGQSGPVLKKPFWATEVRHAVQTLGDSTHVEHSDTSSVYRDAEGRMRCESAERAVIYDPVAQAVYELNPREKTYFKTRLPVGSVSVSIGVSEGRTSVNWADAPGLRRALDAAMRSPSAPSLNEELPAQVVNGILAKGARVTYTIPAGTFGNDREIKVVNERWYSDDLKVLVKSSNSDPRFGVSTYDLINISQAAPTPSLFVVPPDYTLKARPAMH